MKSPHFIIALDGSSYKTMYEHMFTDLFNRKDVSFITDVRRNGKIKNLLTRQKVQALTKGLVDFLAYEENNLYIAIEHYCKKEIPVYVIFLNAALYYNSYVPATLRKYKEKWTNLKYVLFYLDIINTGVSFNANMLREKAIFDLVYTIDKRDAEDIGAHFWYTFYSITSEYLSTNICRDIYFCGADKGREYILANIADQAVKNHVDLRMDVICYGDDSVLGQFTEIVRVRGPKEHMDYAEVIRNELESSCILEVVQDGQAALTLRPYEAIAYNRKLLTNNKTILDFEYYNPEFMQYFDKPEDIDWDWVKRENKVDYQYDGRYSPVSLLNDIRGKFSQGLK